MTSTGKPTYCALPLPSTDQVSECVPCHGFVADTFGEVENVSICGGVAPTAVASNPGSYPAAAFIRLLAPPIGAGGHIAWSRIMRYGTRFPAYGLAPLAGLRYSSRS